MSFSRFKGFSTKPKGQAFIDWTNPLSRGLVGLWLFNESSGTFVQDATGNKNTGTFVNSPAWTGSYFGSGIDFINTETDYINCGSRAIIDNITAKTISVWINPRSYGAANPTSHYAEVVAKFESDGWSLELSDEDAGIQSIYYFQRFGADFGYWHGPADVLTLNKWNHVVMTYNNSSASNAPVFYVNGALVATTTYHAPSGTRSSDAAFNLFIGGFLNGGNPIQLYDGIIDHVGLYNRILTASQVLSLYSNPFQYLVPPWVRRYSPASASNHPHLLQLMGVGM